MGTHDVKELDSQNLRTFTQKLLADLRALDLRDNRLGLEGARELAARGQLTSLRALYLYRDDIGADGARALAESNLPLAIRRYYAALHGARHD